MWILVILYNISCIFIFIRRLFCDQVEAITLLWTVVQPSDCSSIGCRWVPEELSLAQASQFVGIGGSRASITGFVLLHLPETTSQYRCKKHSAARGTSSKKRHNSQAPVPEAPQFRCCIRSACAEAPDAQKLRDSCQSARRHNLLLHQRLPVQKRLFNAPEALLQPATTMASLASLASKLQVRIA